MGVLSRFFGSLSEKRRPKQQQSATVANVVPAETTAASSPPADSPELPKPESAPASAPTNITTTETPKPAAKMSSEAPNRPYTLTKSATLPPDSEAFREQLEKSKQSEGSKTTTPDHLKIGTQLVDFTINTAFKGLTTKEVKDFRPFADWVTAMDKEMRTSPARDHITIKGVEVTDADRFGGGKLGFVKFRADVQWTDQEDQKQTGAIPGIVFARGGSVAILVILTPTDEGDSTILPTDQKPSTTPEEKLDRVILTLQPRIPIGALAFPELPAGMLDGERHQFAGAAARELEEECGITIKTSELIDLTDLALGENDSEFDVSHGKGVGGKGGVMYPSPGGSDEWIKLFLCRKKMRVGEIEELEGKQGGLRDHGERITCKIIKLRDLWKSTRDFKALGAVALYDNLVREGKL
ncbi:hypothetical protein HK097_001081 [Rhizophlyctis rosea]|uniref:Nudix hydrolase domain-containing protein n=1 Tax=Rhizophlyctis rosea TaxID=64517 RepID=A0AAD5S7K7_9FUNG|nr:hypothetical protein HK097_001081 [Rhizophlyctis rosea]